MLSHRLNATKPCQASTSVKEYNSDVSENLYPLNNYGLTGYDQPSGCRVKSRRFGDYGFLRSDILIRANSEHFRDTPLPFFEEIYSASSIPRSIMTFLSLSLLPSEACKRSGNVPHS